MAVSEKPEEGRKRRDRKVNKETHKDGTLKQYNYRLRDTEDSRHQSTPQEAGKLTSHTHTLTRQKNDNPYPSTPETSSGSDIQKALHQQNLG